MNPRTLRGSGLRARRGLAHRGGRDYGAVMLNASCAAGRVRHEFTATFSDQSTVAFPGDYANTPGQVSDHRGREGE
jgi:hypothetical protein